jgi:hypothetical protein
MAAIVDRKEVDQQQLVELITTGRTGSIGLTGDHASAGTV